MEGINGAISAAIERLCVQLTQYKNSTICPQQLPRQIVQPLDHNAANSIDLTQWLKQQPQYPKLYWRSRDQSVQSACLGIAQQYRDDEAAQQLNDGIHYRNNLRYYWLSGFELQPSAGSHQPQQLLFLPLIELRYQPRSTSNPLSLRVTLSSNQKDTAPLDESNPSKHILERSIDELIKQLRQLRPVDSCSAPCSASASTLLNVSGRQDDPSFEQWQHSIQQAKRCFIDGSLQKVVLARQTRFHYSQTDAGPDTTSSLFWSTFERWQHKAINSYQIAYQLSPEQGFISLTPERLFLRQDDDLMTEALAATLARSDNSARARQQALELLSDSKSRHEHGLVAVEIGAKLEGLGVQLNYACGTSLLKQNGLQHLHQHIQGRLPRAEMDAQLMTTLHPTAAVGGLPTEPARQFIRQHEPFERGFYAGCCGYLESQQSELAVTIRSADYHYPELTLYAGAGIVPQSDAKQEWLELEQKIALPLSLLNQTDNELQSEIDVIQSSSIA